MIPSVHMCVCTHTQSHNTQTQAHTGKQAHIHRYTDIQVHVLIHIVIHMGYHRHADTGIPALTYIVIGTKAYTHACTHIGMHMCRFNLCCGQNHSSVNTIFKH